MFLKEDAELIERIYFIILNLIRISLIIAFFGAIFSEEWIILFVAVFTFILTYLPYIVERRYNINIPIEFEFISVAFIYGALFLGEAHGYYTKYWWWDLVLHAGSAIAIGFLGFSILYILYKGKKVEAKPFLLAVFSFFFALGIGALWEIFEFAMDQVFGFNMQRSGLIDTMWDLIVDAAGALLVSLGGFLYLKKKEAFIFTGIMKRFVKDNPSLFRKSRK